MAGIQRTTLEVPQGLGMPSENCKSFFSPFHQQDRHNQLLSILSISEVI